MQYVIANGSHNRFQFIGPFATYEALAAFVAKHGIKEWSLIMMQSPTDPKLWIKP